jgi:hypothetical protein
LIALAECAVPLLEPLQQRTQLAFDFIQHPNHEIFHFCGGGFAHGIHISQSTFVFDFSLPELGK